IINLYVRVMKKCGTGVLVLWSVERGKCKDAAGRFALLNNFLSAFSAEQNQVPRGSIFSSL
ncbi:MAG: hypothetical protein J6X78_01855, partial [Treponema sp.]|nr:hypothetical protein [Treponema sp.]